MTCSKSVHTGVEPSNRHTLSSYIVPLAVTYQHLPTCLTGSVNNEPDAISDTRSLLALHSSRLCLLVVVEHKAEPWMMCDNYHIKSCSNLSGISVACLVMIGDQASDA